MEQVSGIQADRKGNAKAAGNDWGMAAKVMSKNVLDIEEAAWLLNRSVKTIYSRKDEIPHYEGGAGIRFRRDELEAWMCQVKILPQTNY